MRRIDSRGSMPFAVIAVTILVLSTAMAAAAYQYERSSDNGEGAEADIEAVDAAIEDITGYVNRGLGESIRSISVASAEGVLRTDTLKERAAFFEDRAAEWIGFQFPIRSGGVVAHLLGYDVSLTAEALKLGTDTVSDGGYTPAYLRGTGTIQVRLESQSGRAETELEISTDGSYGLPLAAERGSLFEGMMDDGGISVSQMMTYQLTCLAQYRVLNGYGALAAYGEKGTHSIITAEDVETAYSNALAAVGMICFRDGDGRLAGKEVVDLTDLLVSAEGPAYIDLSALYAQALMSVIDDVALRWFDYFCGFQLLDELDRKLNPFRNAVSSLVAFIFGEERVYSAVPYVQKTMELAGIPESEYRHPGTGTTSLSYGGITVSVPNPTADLFSMGWLRDFNRTYLQETNFVMEFILGVLRGAAVSIGERRDLGTVAVETDPFDDSSFIDTLTSTVQAAMSDSDAVVQAAVSSSLSSAATYDEFYGAIADEIDSHSGDFMLSSSLSASLTAEFAEAIPEGSEVTVEGMVDSGALDRAVSGYERRVLSDLEVFDELRRVEGGDGVIKRVLTEICAYGLGLLDITGPVEQRMGVLCDEVLAMNGMNPQGGVTELPGESGFTLTDDSGNTVREHLAATVSSEPMVEGVTIDRGRCVHTVGFRDEESAAYSTVFVIEMSDAILYSIDGSGSLSDAMGTTSSALDSSVPLDVTVEVAVASGWALAGIEYIQSSTFYGDAWNYLMELLEPIIEPLRKVMETIRNMLDAVAESLMEALSFVAEHLARIYEAVMGPLEHLKGWIEETVEGVLSNAALNILVDINMGNQSISLEFFGCVLTVTTSAISWAANTKTLFSASLTMPVAGLTVTAGVTAKVRGDVKAENLILTGFGGVEGDDWSLEVKIDPLMKGSKYLIVVDGEVRGTDFSITAPKLESYHEMGVALSDVPGIGTFLSNIPLGGFSVGIDAGFSLKYSDPQKKGLIVNEFESNPAGDDSGAEWVELLNNSPGAIDLTGYTLSAASDGRKKTMALSGTIAPGEFLVIHPDFTLVNSSGKYTRNGEAVILKGPDGEEIDRSPTRKDGDNDGKTWQRSYDGSTEWVFAEGSMGRTNDAFPLAGVVSAADMKDAVWRAVEKSFGKVESITDLDTLQSFLQYMVRYTLEELISTVSGQLIEAAVYVSADVKDATASASTGIRVALRTDGDLVEDCLRYISGKLQELILGVENPYRIDPLEMFTENIDLEVTVRTGIGFPEILSEGADLPEMDLGVTFRTNLASITRVLGSDTGRPEMVMGVRAINIPAAAIPSKLSAKKNMDHDLWFMQVTVRFS